MAQDEPTKVEVVGPIEDRLEEAMVAGTTTPNLPETVVGIRHPLQTGSLRRLGLLALGTASRPRPRRLIPMVTAAGMVDIAVAATGVEDTTRATAVAAAVATARRLQLPDSTTVEEVVEEDTKARDISLPRAEMATVADMAVTEVMIVGTATTMDIAAKTEFL